MNNRSSNLVIFLVGAASLFLILFGIRGSASVINPILLATIITITVLPIPSALTKRGMKGWLALVLTIVMVVLVLGLVIMTVFFSITKFSTELPTYMARTLPLPTGDTATEFPVDISAMVQGFLGGLLNLLGQFGWALFIFFFMISAALSLPAPSRLGLDPNTPTIGRVTHLTEDVRKYMTILTGINFLVALGDTIFLMILGVDYALLWGLLAWFMGYIPSLGFLIALIPPVLMAYAQYGMQTALIVLVGYILINGGVQNFIQPKFMGERLKISPVVVFIGLLVWGYLLGGIGAILAVPMTMLVLIIMENFEATRPLAVLMRYTGEVKNEERGKAEDQVKDFWEKAKGTISPKEEKETKKGDDK
jgi:AI-2 transport protein TqsA